MTVGSLAGPRLGMGQGVGLGLCPLCRPGAKEPLRTRGGPQRSHQETPIGAGVSLGRPYAHGRPYAQGMQRRAVGRWAARRGWLLAMSSI
jgi:hypothetical protein